MSAISALDENGAPNQGFLYTKKKDFILGTRKVPMLCFDSKHQANYAHHFVPIMLTVNSIFAWINMWQFIRKL